MPARLRKNNIVDITVSVDPGLAELFRNFENNLKKETRKAFRQIADAAVKRMQTSASGRQPYGTGSGRNPPVVRRQGRLYKTIGFRFDRFSGPPSVSIGAIKGTRKGRQLAAIHGIDIDTVIRRKFNQIIFPPFGSPARDPVSGDQIMTVKEAKEHFYTMFSKGSAIMVKESRNSTPVVAFIKKDSVKIPGRGIIFREHAKILSKMGEKNAQIIDNVIGAGLGRKGKNLSINVRKDSVLLPGS